MKTRVLMATVGAASAVFAAGVVWTTPSASAGTPFCDSLGKPQQIQECNCGFDFAPGSPELQACMSGNAVAPTPPRQ